MQTCGRRGCGQMRNKNFVQLLVQDSHALQISQSVPAHIRPPGVSKNVCIQIKLWLNVLTGTMITSVIQGGAKHTAVKRCGTASSWEKNEWQQQSLLYGYFPRVDHSLIHQNPIRESVTKVNFANALRPSEELELFWKEEKANVKKNLVTMFK